MKPKLSAAEALIYTMFTASAADRKVTDIELERISFMVRDLPAFQGYSGDWLADESQACGRLLIRPGGLGAVLDTIAAALPEELRETAYALAADVIASDDHLQEDEAHFLTLLAQKLEIDPLIRLALERGAKARHLRIGS